MTDENGSRRRRDGMGGVARIGFLVWWSMVDSTFEVVNRALREAGIEPQGFVKRPAYHYALRRAAEKVARQLRAESSGINCRESFLLLPRAGTSKSARYDLKVEVMDGNVPVIHDLSVIMATEDEDITWSDNHPVVDRVVEAYRAEREVCAGERTGRSLVEIALREGRATCLRKDGGLYYFPWHGAEHKNPGLTVIRAVVKAIDGAHLHEVTVYDDRRTRKSIEPAARAALLHEVDALERRVQKWTGHKKKSLNRANEQNLLPIRKRVEHYESRLGCDLEEVKVRCDEVSVLIDEKLEHRVRRRPRLEVVEEPVADPEDDGLNSVQRRLLDNARGSIAEAVARQDPYLRNICDVALAAVAKDCGVDHANAVIEDLGLTEACGVRPLEEHQS